MSETNTWQIIEEAVTRYIEMAKRELHARWEKWPLDLSKREMHEVIGALLARQVTLAVQLAQSPGLWNGHIASIILRAMTDNYINLAWILDDPLDRSRKFILHGLGQEKLQLEHLKARMIAGGKNPDDDAAVQEREQWLDSQRYTFLTEVNVGSWSGIDARRMAEEAGCIDLYNSAYTPFSASTHNMWNHIAQYNLAVCPNPLHRHHRIPVVLSLGSDLDYISKAAEYVTMAFNLFDVKAGISANTPSAFDALVQSLNDLKQTEGAADEG